MARKKVVRPEWREYLNVIAPVADVRQVQFVERVLDKHEDVSLDQTTVSNWRRGLYSPPRSAVIVAVAEAFDREPLEALVAAGLVDIDWVTKSLSRDGLRVLKEIGIEPTAKG